MADLGKLVALVKQLRGPGGCPWDQKQGLADLRAYLLEEAHEAAAALDRVLAGGAWADLAEELGDLLFQVAFILRLADEADAFEPSEVVNGVHAKMVERHPHVFPPAGGEAETLEDAEAVARAWERRKLERAGSAGLLAGVADSLPALLAAYRLTQKAAGVGFDWPDTEAVLAKVDEELAEVRAELAAGDREAAAREVGDLLFSVANLARKLGVDPEQALAATNGKFRRRFAAVEDGLERRGRGLAEADLAEMDALWEAAKADED